MKKVFRLLANLHTPTAQKNFCVGAALALASCTAFGTDLSQPVFANDSVGVLAKSSTMRLARADEFDIVPMGHPLYRDLVAVQRAGWASNKGTLKAALTRYEMAVDTAKAIVAVTARREMESTWPEGISRPAVRSLRTLTQALRPELTDMGVDVAATLKLLNDALQPQLPSVKPADVTASARMTAPAANSTQAGLKVPTEINVQLSQRLRLSAALSALARETSDPLGDSALLGAADTASSSARVALGLGDRLTLHAGVARRDVPTQSSSLLLQALRTPAASELSTRSGGLDLRVSPSMTFTGQIENLEADGSPSWKRYTGGVGFSAWQNRLTLKANLSRLVPEDVRLLPSTMADFGLGFDVNERTRLSLLYQQLFSVAPEEPNRYLAGGISISF